MDWWVAFWTAIAAIAACTSVLIVAVLPFVIGPAFAAFMMKSTSEQSKRHRKPTHIRRAMGDGQARSSRSAGFRGIGVMHRRDRVGITRARENLGHRTERTRVAALIR